MKQNLIIILLIILFNFYACEQYFIIDVAQIKDINIRLIPDSDFKTKLKVDYIDLTKVGIESGYKNRILDLLQTSRHLNFDASLPILSEGEYQIKIDKKDGTNEMIIIHYSGYFYYKQKLYENETLIISLRGSLLNEIVENINIYSK